MQRGPCVCVCVCVCVRVVQSIRKGRTRWSQMSNQEQAEILAALDSVTYDGLGRSLKDQAAQLGQDGWLWQVGDGGS